MCDYTNERWDRIRAFHWFWKAYKCLCFQMWAKESCVYRELLLYKHDGEGLKGAPFPIFIPSICFRIWRSVPVPCSSAFFFVFFFCWLAANPQAGDDENHIALWGNLFFFKRPTVSRIGWKLFFFCANWLTFHATRRLSVCSSSETFCQHDNRGYTAWVCVCVFTR